MSNKDICIETDTDQSIHATDTHTVTSHARSARNSYTQAIRSTCLTTVKSKGPPSSHSSLCSLLSYTKQLLDPSTALVDWSWTAWPWPWDPITIPKRRWRPINAAKHSRSSNNSFTLFRSLISRKPKNTLLGGKYFIFIFPFFFCKMWQPCAVRCICIWKCY